MDLLVSTAACQKYAPALCRRALTEVLEPLGGLDWVCPGMHVVIKANLVSFLKPEAAATTHPQLLAALTELLRERGARVTVGDSPGGLYQAAFVNRVYRAAGMDVVQAAGAALNQDFSQADALFPQARAARTFHYTRYLDDADAIINFCKLKTHAMMGMSAGVKNLFGTIPGTLKPEYHFRFPDLQDFAAMLVDLNDYFRPVLTICDAVTAMEGNGPTMGTPRPVGLVLASASPHALDLACARLIGLEPDTVPTLQEAVRRGYLPSDFQGLTVTGPYLDCRPDSFALVETPGSLVFQDGSGPFGRLRGAVIRKAMCPVPPVDAALCVGCGHCAQVCPAKAITLKKGLPAFHRRSCIRCFCCQEFCPKGALSSRRPPLARLLNRVPGKS